MITNYFRPPVTRLSPGQLREWQRRQSIAQNTLEIQTLGGTLPDIETIRCFQSYVDGELSLTEAIVRVRQQMVQEREMLRQYVERRNII